MENASKALIIAGAILISILVISLGIMTFKTMYGSVEGNADLDKQEISAFNSRISPYIGENVSGSQVNALIQYARTVNQKVESNQENKVKHISIYKEDSNDENFDRVQTGGTYYKVEGEYEGGLLTKIRIKGSNTNP